MTLIYVYQNNLIIFFLFWNNFITCLQKYRRLLEQLFFIWFERDYAEKQRSQEIIQNYKIKNVLKCHLALFVPLSGCTFQEYTEWHKLY